MEVIDFVAISSIVVWFAVVIFAITNYYRISLLKLFRPFMCKIGIHKRIKGKYHCVNCKAGRRYLKLVS